MPEFVRVIFRQTLKRNDPAHPNRDFMFPQHVSGKPESLVQVASLPDLYLSLSCRGLPLRNQAAPERDHYCNNASHHKRNISDGLGVAGKVSPALQPVPIGDRHGNPRRNDNDHRCDSPEPK